MKYDVLIIGAGIAGLHAAMRIPKEKSCLILCKDQPWECNTFYAQGGVATAVDKDDIELHIKDTIEAGAGLCDEETVRILSEDSIEIISDLIEQGLEFDRNSDGTLKYTREGAHTRSRILHAEGDGTGRIMHSFLISKLEHTLFKNALVTSLLIDDDRCYGASVVTKKGEYNIYADNVIIASGGIGSMFEYHTNAHTVSGEIHGMALEHGIALRDMEFVQFHPTVYVDNSWARKLLLSEALRGEGAYIVDSKNQRFLFDYDKRGELAPRDVISRALFDYKEKKNEQIFLSFEQFKENFLKERFPNIHRNLTSIGFQIPRDKIPISPAFHYSMGGIKTDLNGKVEGMLNLYAIGEVASTRVHGANRLASNSLLEGLVFSKRAVKAILSDNFRLKTKNFQNCSEELYKEQDKILKETLRSIMWKNVGVVRDIYGLKSALGGVEVMLQTNIGRMFRLRLLVAREIIQSAIARKESIGAHYITKGEI